LQLFQDDKTLRDRNPFIDISNMYIDHLDDVVESIGVDAVGVLLSEIVFWNSSITRNSDNEVSTCEGDILLGRKIEDSFRSIIENIHIGEWIGRHLDSRYGDRSRLRWRRIRLWWRRNRKRFIN